MVKAPKGAPVHVPRWNESVDVQIELPAGSRVQAEAGVAAFRCQGPLGESRFKIVWRRPADKWARCR